jgi:hypothetical protein
VTRIASIFAFLLAATFSSATLAQTPEQRANCADDVRKFCSGVNPAQGGIARCLAQNKEKLSPGCRKASRI